MFEVKIQVDEFLNVNIGIQFCGTVSGANPDIRDYSGRKPNQYETSQTQTANKDTFSEYRKHGKHESRLKHHSFLRKSKNFTHSPRRIKSTAESTTAM